MIDLYEFPKAVCFTELMSLVEERNCVRVNDFSGMFSKQATIFEKNLKKKYLEKHHPELVKFLYTLDKPNPTGEDWERDSDEIKMRVTINNALKLSEIEKEVETKYPYRNYWHYLLNDHDIRQGINLIHLDSDIDWVQEINQMIIDVVEESEAYDKLENTVCCYIEW